MNRVVHFEIHAKDVPGVGTLAYRKDPDGNIFGVLQPTAG